MSTEKVVREIREERIQRAALQLAGRDVLTALNLANIARQVGLVPFAIYRDFLNKAALLDAMLSTMTLRLPGCGV